MHRYGQLNESNICVVDSYLAGEVIMNIMIRLTLEEPSPLGMIWNPADQTWSEPPPPEEV